MARWQAEAAAADFREVDASFFGGLIAGGSALTDSAVDVPDLADLSMEERRQPPTYVPNRNLVLLSLAAAYAEALDAQDVFYGAQAQDQYGYWDCTTEFVKRLNDVLSLNRRRPVRIHAPFAELRKVEVVKIGLALGVDYTHTWSCYRGGKAACGTVQAVPNAATAFREAGL